MAWVKGLLLRALALEKWLFTAGPKSRQDSRENEHGMNSIISKQHLYETGRNCLNQVMQG